MQMRDGGRSEDELIEHEVLDLPNREAMSLIQPGLGLIEGNLVAPPEGTFGDPTQPASPPASESPAAPTQSTPADKVPQQSDLASRPPATESDRPYQPSASATATDQS